MKSIVIGATGIVGGYIVEQLVRSGQRPFALSRQAQSDPRIDWIQGDLAAIGALSIHDCDTVFCTADVSLLANALVHLDHSNLKRVVVFTSTSIVTKMESEIAYERDHLQRMAEGEHRLIALCELRGIGWTILRPTIIYAEGRDGNVSRLARLIRKFGFLPLMGSGAGLRQPVHAEDLATGAIQAANSPFAANKTYALPGGETISYREMVGRIFDALGQRRLIISAPPLIWRIAFAVAKPFFPNANSAMGSRMAIDMVFDCEPARRDFGWSPRKFRPRFGFR